MHSLYDLMYSNSCVHHCNHYPSQDMEYSYHLLQIFSYFRSVPTHLPSEKQPPFWFISTYFGLYLLCKYTYSRILYH